MVPHFLRRHYLKNIQSNTDNKKIYISRRKSPIRKLIEEDLLVDLLVNEFNYIEVFLEDLNLEQQAILLNECSHVIAPHGAGLPNIVYCNPGTKVLEILPYTWTNVIYWIYAEYQHLEYSVFLAGDKNSKSDGYLDYHLDLESFKEFVIKSGF
jgi:capsular polysaccharide biosynthesis protein